MEPLRLFIIMSGIVLSLSQGEAIDWCATLLRCAEAKNTMCAFADENRNTGNCSDQKDLIQGNKSLQDYWLALHNTFRDQVAAGFVPGLPSASNMEQLVWNDILALQARRWAFQCMYEDDPCSKSPVYKNMLPEMVNNETLVVGKLVSNVRAAFLARFLENVNGYQSYPSTKIDALDETLQSYQQVNLVVHTFAEMREIGASLVLYKWFEDGSQHLFLKSNTYYGPPITKGPVYKRGEPCSKCREGFKCNRKSTYTHLCAALTDPHNGEYTEGMPGAENSKNLAATNFHIGSIMLVALIVFAQSPHWAIMYHCW